MSLLSKPVCHEDPDTRLTLSILKKCFGFKSLLNSIDYGHVSPRNGRTLNSTVWLGTAIEKRRSRPATAASTVSADIWRLWRLAGERVPDPVERGLEVAANRCDGGDDHDRNASGDQAILDRGGTRLVLEKCKYFRHPSTPCCCCCTMRSYRLKASWADLSNCLNLCQGFPDMHWVQCIMRNSCNSRGVL